MMNKPRNHHNGFLDGIGHLASFCVAGFLPTFLLVSAFLMGTGSPGGFLSWLYAASIPFFYLLVVLVLTLLISPLYFLRRTRYLVIAPLVILDFYLMIDLFIFNVYRFHLDAVYFYIIMNDFWGIGLPLYMIALIALGLGLILVKNILALRWAGRFRKWALMALPALVLLYLSGQLVHAWAAEYHQSAIMRYDTNFPYYYPIKASKFIRGLAEKHPSIVPAHTAEQDLSLGMDPENASLPLAYPLKKIQCRPAGRERPNVVFFLLESWRSDMMNASVTPNINGLAAAGSLFTDHFSGGNVTPTGIFSLMFGLHPTYMRYIDTDPRRYPPVLMSVLRENGYAIGAYTSSNLKGFAMKEMIFGDIPDKDYRVHYGKEEYKDLDRLVINDLIASLKNRKPGTPFFKFVFLTSSHYGYSFPEDKTIFAPVSREGAFMFNKYADPAPLLNRYRNALHYDDSLFGEVMRTLRDEHLDKNTVIVVTSDHAEEFNDKGRGYWGHGSDFTRYQCSVPLVLYLPGRPGGQVIRERSAHIDVVPTLMNYLFSCANDISDYSSGADLFRLPAHRGLVVRSYGNKACIIDDTVYVESIPLKRYAVDDVGSRSTKFDAKAIEFMKASEGHFVRRGR